jgi:hypothetical protein
MLHDFMTYYKAAVIDTVLFKKAVLTNRIEERIKG